MACEKATVSYRDGNVTWHSCNAQRCDKGYRYKDGMGCCDVGGLSYGSD